MRSFQGRNFYTETLTPSRQVHGQQDV